MAAPALVEISTITNRTKRFKITQSGANQGSVTLHFPKPLAALTVQGIGASFDSASIALTVSNDGSTFIAPVTAFTAITAAAVRQLSQADLGFLYYRFTWSSAGASADTTLQIVARELV